MRVLAFVDVHNNQKALQDIKKKAVISDIVVCAGDISIFENKLDYMVEQLSKIKKTVLIIHGNHETKEKLETACKNFPNLVFLHEKCYTFNSTIFFGYGGGGFSLTDTRLEKVTKSVLRKISNNKLVLITHAPPYGTKLDIVLNQHCGNKTLTEIIKRLNPTLVITGHFHENAGVSDRINKTKVVNPGPHGKIITI